MAYCIKKDNLHFSLVLEERWLGMYSVITTKKLNLKIHHRNFCLSKKEDFRKTACPKTQVGWVIAKSLGTQSDHILEVLLYLFSNTYLLYLWGIVDVIEKHWVT